jgi:hypothetical protein
MDCPERAPLRCLWPVSCNSQPGSLSSSSLSAHLRSVCDAPGGQSAVKGGVADKVLYNFRRATDLTCLWKTFRDEAPRRTSRIRSRPFVPPARSPWLGSFAIESAQSSLRCGANVSVSQWRQMSFGGAARKCHHLPSLIVPLLCDRVYSFPASENCFPTARHERADGCQVPAARRMPTRAVDERILNPVIIRTELGTSIRLIATRWSRPGTSLNRPSLNNVTFLRSDNRKSRAQISAGLTACR